MPALTPACTLARTSAMKPAVLDSPSCTRASPTSAGPRPGTSASGFNAATFSSVFGQSLK